MIGSQSHKKVYDYHAMLAIRYNGCNPLYNEKDNVFDKKERVCDLKRSKRSLNGIFMMPSGDLHGL